MSDGIYRKCEECNSYKMLYPEYLWFCKTCYGETVEQFEDFDGVSSR
ncbi:hypothetical protein OB955_04765 [Halobacteria archaeon AArc-m2/3/4]|uniref:Small CPxCG-related zinc finger protein n=1 Tax=Natronoglomus mannanivorans TaxID=2979990 RepID=A0ABT2QAU8_9EURY|nr:hypothetical protein [Halobacteria archaeon AArc-m2/3/4]